MIEIELTPGERIIANWAFDRLLEEPARFGSARHLPIIGEDIDLKVVILAFPTTNSNVRQSFHQVLIDYPEITHDRDWGSTHCYALWKKIEDATKIEQQEQRDNIWRINRIHTQETFNVTNVHEDPDMWAYERWAYWRQRAQDHPGGVRRVRCMARAHYYRRFKYSGYAGHKNRETWLVNLWLLSDKHYTFVHEVVNEQMEHVSAAAVFLRQYVEQHMLLDEHTLVIDLVLHALADVAWHAIASGLQEN